MKTSSASPARGGALLAIHLLFLMVWGFAGIGKVALAACALLDGEFLGRSAATKPTWMLVWSLSVSVQPSSGLGLTSGFTGGTQMSAFFAGTLVSLHFGGGASAPANAPRGIAPSSRRGRRDRG